MYRFVLLVLVLGGWTRLGAAQAPRAAPTQRECEAGIADAASDPRSARFARAFSNTALHRCGEPGAIALANAVRKLPLVPDSLVVRSLYFSSVSTRHPRILRAALALAADRRASARARVAGMQISMRQMDAGVALLGPTADLATRPMGRFCRYDYIVPAGYDSEFPMVANVRAQVASAMRALAADSREAVLIRDLATCVLRKAEPALLN